MWLGHTERVRDPWELFNKESDLVWCIREDFSEEEITLEFPQGRVWMVRGGERSKQEGFKGRKCVALEELKGLQSWSTVNEGRSGLTCEEAETGGADCAEPYWRCWQGIKWTGEYARIPEDHVRKDLGSPDERSWSFGLEWWHWWQKYMD